MRCLAIQRQSRHVAPPADDQAGFWRSCEAYWAAAKAEGTLEAYWFVNMMPPGLAAPANITGAAIINVDDMAAAEKLLMGYPGYDCHGGVRFELVLLSDDGRGYTASERGKVRFLAMGKPTLVKAPEALDKAAFEQSCKAYLEGLRKEGVIEYYGWAFGPGQVKAYVVLHVDSHEEMFAAMQRYPGTLVQEGLQWQFHTLLDSQFCYGNLIEEAEAAKRS